MGGVLKLARNMSPSNTTSRPLPRSDSTLSPGSTSTRWRTVEAERCFSTCQHLARTPSASWRTSAALGFSGGGVSDTRETPGREGGVCLRSVCVFVLACVCVCLFECLCLCVCMCLHVCVLACVCVCLSVSVSFCASVRVCVYLRASVCLRVCV